MSACLCCFHSAVHFHLNVRRWDMKQLKREIDAIINKTPWPVTQGTERSAFSGWPYGNSADRRPAHHPKEESKTPATEQDEIQKGGGAEAQSGRWAAVLWWSGTAGALHAANRAAGGSTAQRRSDLALCLAHEKTSAVKEVERESGPCLVPVPSQPSPGAASSSRQSNTTSPANGVLLLPSIGTCRAAAASGPPG